MRIQQMWGGDLKGSQQRTKRRGKEGLRQPEKGVHRTVVTGAMEDTRPRQLARVDTAEQARRRAGDAALLHS